MFARRDESLALGSGYGERTMRNTGKLLVAVAAMLTGCGINGRISFREAFPDPSVLITTSEPLKVRRQLDHVVLPDDRAHNEALLQMLQSEDSMDAAHLVLLVRAVSMPENFTVSNGERRWAYAKRGEGANAALVDQMLIEGSTKVRDIDAYWFGEMVGISQADATMRLLCERFVPQLDDGSDRVLSDMLRGMPGSPAMLPFLCDYMGPEGRLDGERGWQAFARLSFDADRARLLASLMQRSDEVTAERLLLTVKAFSFDSGRNQALDLLIARAKPIAADVARAAVATFAFDSGRGSAFAALAQQGGTQLDEAGLVSFVNLCSFDSGRLRCVELFAPSLLGDTSVAAATQLLRCFSFDSDRGKAVKLLAPRWQGLSKRDREQLLTTFSFDTSRKRARADLGL